MKPLVTVIIPTYSRRPDLERTLRAYEGQVPEELPFEVIVVDDGSTDDTRQFLDQFHPQRYSLTWEGQKNQGPAAARNRGLRRAAAPLVLITGDDIAPTPGLLAQHLEAHRDLGDDRWAVLGRIDWPPELALTTTMRHISGRGAEQFSYHYMEDGAEYDYRHFYTSNISVARRLLEKEPTGFSTDFPAAAFEDAELAYRLVSHGLRIRYRETAVAHHYHHYGARSFFQRQVRCGRMARILVAKFPETGRVLGVGEVPRLRRRVRWSLHLRRRHWDRRVRELDGQVETALGTAEAIDGWSRSQLDRASFDPTGFLVALFRYGYLRGLAETSCSPALVEPVSAALFSRHLEEPLRVALRAVERPVGGNTPGT